jgi:hypothetical protein
MFASLAAAAPLPPAAHPAAASAPVAAPPLVDACPPQLPVRQALTQDFPGWTSLNEQASYPFTRIVLYAGPPAEGSRLVPTSEYRTASGLHDAWTLPRRAAGYWVACNYGNTAATLARRLPDNVDHCLADYDGRFVTLVVRRWACGERRLLAPARVTQRAQAARPAASARAPGRRQQ